MAIDKSKENTRIAKYLAMSAADVHLLCSVGINNPAILKQFQDDTFKWEYAVAAGLLEESDVEWIKEHANDNEGQHEEPPAEPSNGNGTNA